jgi:hypothetical protein
MMSTRRSLFTLAAVGLGMLVLVGSAVAQDTTPAIALPGMDPASNSDTAATAITLAVAAGMPVYSTHQISWTVPDEYRSNCGPNTDGRTDQSGEACHGMQTPLIGYVIYKSTKTFTNAQSAEVVVKVAGTGAPASGVTGDAKHKKVMTDLTPNTRYYIALAAENGFGVGPLSPIMTFQTAKAPLPDRVADVMVEPRNAGLMATWTAPHPDVVDQTDLKIAEYNVQYQTAATASRAVGDWMPEKPMVVVGTMTETTITGLTNGTMYNVRVRAKNSAGGVGGYSRVTDDASGTPSADAATGGTTPTPALPVFGILGLGAGLVAAGRRRLRRRQQLLNS